MSQKKTSQYNLTHNFAKCWLIFKILSLTDSLVNLQQNLSHRTLNVLLYYEYIVKCHNNNNNNHLRPFVRDNPGEPVPEETLTHPPSWSSSSLYQLLPSTTIRSILLVQITCLAIFLHNLFSCPLWYPSWSGALHLIFHSFLHPVSVFFSQHMPIPSQPVLL